MDLPKIDPVAYDRWKLQGPPEEPFFEEPVEDWNFNVITDGKYFKTEDGLVQDIEIKDWAESRFETTYFEDGKEV